MLQDSVVAISILRHDHLKFAIAGNFGPKPERGREQLQVLVDNCGLVMPLQLLNGHVRTVVFDEVEEMHSWVALRSIL